MFCFGFILSYLIALRTDVGLLLFVGVGHQYIHGGKDSDADKKGEISLQEANVSYGRA
jgi:hypothetical protein